MSDFNKEKFNEDIYQRIKNLILDYNLIESGETIAIAISGGKDSLLTLHALSKFRETIDFDLIAISVDEGISGYREDGIKSAIKNSDDLRIKIIQKSFKEETNFNLDDIHHLFKSSCIPCGVFRRNILNKTAFEIGADKIATGHNLDDEIQSFLMSFSRNDTFKFSKFGPKLDLIHPKLIPRIKPLWNTPEKEVGIWAVLNNIDVHFDECPYSHMSLRAKTKKFLNDAEENNHGLKQNILESFKSSLKPEVSLNNNYKENTFNVSIKECKTCKQPCSSDICKSCELIKFIEENK